MPNASVVVLTHNSADTLGACLDALVAQLDEADADLLVVDNGSVDGSATIAAARGVQVLDAGTNLGFAAGCNLGVAATTGDVVVLVNPDATLAPGTLRRLVAVARAGIHGPVGGVARHADGSFDARCTMGSPSLLGAITFATGIDKVLRGNAVADPEHGLTRLPSGGTEVRVDAVSGAVLAVDRVLWDQLGGFDERFFVYGEDVDLCLRATALGRVPILALGADYHHVGGMATDATLQRRRMLFRGKVDLYRRHLPGPAGAIATTGLVVGTLLRGAPALAPGGDQRPGSQVWLSLYRDRASWRDGNEPAPDAGTERSDHDVVAHEHPDRPVGDRRPTATVIVPAHDEGGGITTTLRTLLADAEPDEFDVVVVCNGCSDDTADRARTVDGVRVEELTTPSKVGALRHGDRVAQTFPRIYLDGDVQLTTTAARALVASLQDPAPAVAGVRGRVDAGSATLPSRLYFDFRQRLPVFHTGIIGAGVYAMNEAGRARFDDWPDVVADDQFVLRLFGDHERTTVAGHHTRVEAAADLRTVIRRQLRVRRGNTQLSAGTDTTPARTAPPAGIATALSGIRSQPSAWPGALTWASTNLLVRALSRLPRVRGDW